MRTLRASCLAIFCLLVLAALSARAQSVNLFPPNHDDPQHEVWTRIAIPPDHPVSNVAQWHIDYAKKQIVCDGNGGHEWLRFNKELTNFTFHVKWRFTPITTGKPITTRAYSSATTSTAPSGTRGKPRSEAVTSSAPLPSTAR